MVRTATARLHRRLRTAAAGTEALAITDALTAFTVDVTSALAFGHDLNTLEHGDGQLQRDIQRVLTMSGRRIAAPIPYWRWLKLPADRALDRSMVAVYRAIEGFIERAQERMAARPELFDHPENLIEGLLAAQRADGSFTDQEIAGNLITVLFAGEDTTAHTLAWTIWLLGSRPEIQEKLGMEASEAFGDDASPTEYATTERLPYAEAVLCESMRLKSVTPVLGMEPLEERTICGTRIPAGTQLLLLTRQATRTAAGRSEDFLPERWLEESGGAGPRSPPRPPEALLTAKHRLHPHGDPDVPLDVAAPGGHRGDGILEPGRRPHPVRKPDVDRHGASSGAGSISRARPAAASTSIAQRQGASGGGSIAYGSIS